MKKLFLSILFAVGFFAISQAQTLFYNVDNNTSNAWSFKIGDANGNSDYHAPFFGNKTGNWGNFAFQLEFGGSSPLIGCNAYANLTSAPSSGFVSFICPVSNIWSYSLTYNATFNLYFLNVSID